MSFTKEQIILSVPNSKLADIITARDRYGLNLPLRPRDVGSEVIKTLLGHKDRDGSGDLRAGVLGTTVIGVPLPNDRTAFRGHFSQGLIDALGVDPLLSGCEILTEEEFSNIIPSAP